MKHGQLSLHNMSLIVELVSDVMDVGVYNDLFCSVLQFKTRYGLLVSKLQEIVEEENVIERKERQNQTTTVFKEDISLLHYY